MSKLRVVIFMIAAAALLALAGCTTGTAVQPDCPPLNRFGQKNIGNTGSICNYEGPVVVTPTPTPAADEDDGFVTLDVDVDAEPTASQMTPTASAKCGDVDFSNYVGRPYDLISLLDSQEGKIPQPSQNFTVVAENAAVLYWTGAYPSGKIPTGFDPKVVDGDTGVFCVDAGTAVTVNFVGAYMPVSLFNPNVEINQQMQEPTSCMPIADVANILNTYAPHDLEAMYRNFDAAVNVEGAPHLSARLRSPGDQAWSYQVKNTQAIWWVKTGAIDGPVLDLGVTSNGKSLYLATEDGEVNLLHAHGGVVICEHPDGGGLNPERDIKWWGQ